MNDQEKSALDQLGTVTEEFVEKMIQELINDPSEAGQAALDFVMDKKDALIGIGATALAGAFKNMAAASDDHGQLLAAKRSYINSLGMTEVVRFHRFSVMELEEHAEPPFRLGSFFTTIAEYAVGAAPKILGAILSIAGIGF